jgi:hypothetical protein
MTVACLDIMRATTQTRYELVLVETGGDMLRGWADGQAADVTYLCRPKKTTYVQDFNAALDVASGDYVAQTGNDVFCRPGWLEALLECFERFPDCGAASLGTWEGGGLTHRPLPLIVEGWYDPLMMWRKKDRPVDLWRFDEAYESLYSTSDLIMRLYAAGYRAYRNHRVVCAHIGQQTWSDQQQDDIRPRAEALFKERWADAPYWAATMFFRGAVAFGREHERFSG